MEGRKRTGLAWEDSGEIYSDKLKQLRTLRALKTSTLSVVSAITLSIRFGCLPLTDRAPESSLRLSPRVPTPRWLYWVSPRQLLQSDTGVPHFALDPLTYRCLLSLSPAADFAEPRPPRHNQHWRNQNMSLIGYIAQRWKNTLNSLLDLLSAFAFIWGYLQHHLAPRTTGPGLTSEILWLTGNCNPPLTCL